MHCVFFFALSFSVFVSRSLFYFVLFFVWVYMCMCTVSVVNRIDALIQIGYLIQCWSFHEVSIPFLGQTYLWCCHCCCWLLFFVALVHFIIILFNVSVFAACVCCCDYLIVLIWYLGSDSGFEFGYTRVNVRFDGDKYWFSGYLSFSFFVSLLLLA